MYLPRKTKKGHALTVVSRKSVNGFIEHGLRIIAAKPQLFFHQTLTFPLPITDAKTAKVVFTKFIKGVLKFYAKNDMAVVYFQERRKVDGTIHFHVCFLFFNAERLPGRYSRRRRDFRTDIFKRWNDLNGGSAVHPANTLEEHPFNQDSLLYFARALTVTDESESTRRAETNWWGGFNNHVVFARYPEPIARQQRKAMFDTIFKRSIVKLEAATRNGVV